MEYRYITQDIIDAGSVNVTDPAVYDEAREYNINATRNYVRRRRNHIFIVIWFAVQPLIIFLFLFFMAGFLQLSQTNSGTTTSNARILVGVAGLVACLVIYGYFVVLRRQRTALFMFLATLPLLLAAPLLAFIPVMNFFIGHWYNSWEKRLSKEPGYPGFSQLSVTTIDSDANTVEEVTFDSIRERAVKTHRHDGTFLK